MEENYIEKLHNDTCNEIEKLPFQESPNGRRKKFSAAVGGLMYIGFSENCDCLLTVSSTGRGLWDLSNGERIERFYEKDCEGLNEKNMTCRGIGLLSDEIIRVAGL